MKAFFSLLVLFFSFSLFSQGSITSRSDVDWTTKLFKSEIAFDMKSAGLELPSGKSTAAGLIKLKMPGMIKDPILNLFVDSQSYVGDLVLDEIITLEQVTRIVENGKKTPEVFLSDGNTLNTKNTIDMNTISSQLVKHRYPYTIEEPLDVVSTKKYSGIIIDARGRFPIHGEYVDSQVYPCFFPKIWDEEMNLVYEKNMTDPNIAKEQGIVSYNYSDDFTLYEDRVGTDPFYIKAYKVYGRNRSDILIRKRDALKISSLKENGELLHAGKVILLLDKDNLIYDVKVPVKDPVYYASLKQIKQYMYENKVNDVDLTDSVTGFKFSADLKFVPDSPELLPVEKKRIQNIAAMLTQILESNEFTILVEGHTADLGKPVGQMNLSIERTRTVIQALVKCGVPEELFTYKGYGATKPLADNKTEEGRRQNRRVDIIARPKATYIQRDW